MTPLVNFRVSVRVNNDDLTWDDVEGNIGDYNEGGDGYYNFANINKDEYIINEELDCVDINMSVTTEQLIQLGKAQLRFNLIKAINGSYFKPTG